MSDPIQTTVSAASRTITQLLENGRTVRYALASNGNGDVYWRQDTFAAADDVVQPLRWLSHAGPLTVDAVLAAIPQCDRAIRAWTQAEIDDEFAAADLDASGRERRERALIRLRDELAASDDDEQVAAEPGSSRGNGEESARHGQRAWREPDGSTSCHASRSPEQ